MAVHTVYHGRLPLGDRGVDITVGLMLGFIRMGARMPGIRSLARRLERKNRADTLRRFFDYCRNRIRYELDPPDEELVRAPWLTLLGAEKVGDCDCMTVALGALCGAVGIDCWIKVIEWREDSDGEFTHVYLLADAGGGWAIPLDIVRGDMGFGSEQWPVKRHKEYRV